MPKIVLFVTQLMPTGGIESHTLSFCDKMHEQGINIDIIVPNFAMGELEYTRLQNSCNRVLIHRGKFNGFKNILWLLFQGFRLILQKYDAVYTNGQGESIGFFSRIMFRRKRWVHQIGRAHV